MNRPVRASHPVRDADRHTVFAALLDVPGFTEWGYGLRRARILDAEEVKPGATFEFVLSAAGLTHRVTSTVTRVDPPERLEWRYTGGAAGSGGWLLEESGPGAVRMTLYTDYEIKPAWLNRVAHRPFFRRVTEDLLRRSLRRFGESLGTGRT